MATFSGLTTNECVAKNKNTKSKSNMTLMMVDKPQPSYNMVTRAILAIAELLLPQACRSNTCALSQKVHNLVYVLSTLRRSNGLLCSLQLMLKHKDN